MCLVFKENATKFQISNNSGNKILTDISKGDIFCLRNIETHEYLFIKNNKGNLN
jgi:hypothetical protein